jgi:hypothetical protein
MDIIKMIERAQALNAEKRSILDKAREENDNQLNDEQRSRIEAIDAEFGNLKLSIGEARSAQELDKQAEETRTATQTQPVAVKVTHEPAVYERDSRRSFVLDSWHASRDDSEAHEARQRLSAHQRQIDGLMANGAPEARQIEAVVRAEHRSNGDTADRAVNVMRERGAQAEQRDVTGVTTAAGSGGSFVPPVYLLSDYAPYRQAGRTFINAANSKPLPSYGMVINIPTVSNAATVTVHGTQNTSVSSTNLTTSNVTANVQSVIGQMVVSVEDMERQAYAGGFDEIVFDQLTRAYNVQADQIAITQALAGAGAIAYTSGSPTLQQFYSKVAGAEASIRTAAGIFGNPTHMFLQPTRWGYLTVQFDASNRPVIVPNVAGPQNAVAAGSPTGNVGTEGDTGFWMLGLRVLQDANIPTPGTGADQAIVADMSSVLVMESGIRPFSFDQTYANQASVLLQVRGYLAATALYPLAVQSISGTGMATVTF